ncbi:helix-turn-helix domain-containing protein [Gemella morbillorum]
MDKKIDKKAVGKRIFNIRNSLNLTLEQFGKLDNLKASKSIVLRWENGTSLPNRSRLETIAKIGNMTVNELLYGNSEKDKEELFEGIIKLPRGDVIDLMMRVAKVFEMETDDKIKKEE